MKNFNVIWQDFNTKTIEPYDIMPYFIDEYKKDKKEKSKELPKTFSEFKTWIERKSGYMYWSRCQYEIIICGWPNMNTQEKWDIHRQIMMNIDIVAEILMDNIKSI